MRVLPGLTSTDKGAIGGFLRELREGSCREIAFFPTCLSRAEREEVYAELGRVPGLRIPHVHLRDDMGREEIELLAGRFGSEVFNVHPRASSHPYRGDPGPWRSRIFVENADAVPVAEELTGWGGLCLDFAHWASGRVLGVPAYAPGGFEALCRESRIGCCHISSFRPGVRSSWGGFDHHRFESREELRYVLEFAGLFPELWASLELENSLREQLEAAEMLEKELESLGQNSTTKPL